MNPKFKKSLFCKMFIYVLLINIAIPIEAYALPATWTVESGTVTVNQTSPDAMTFTTSDAAVINFESFSIDAGQSVEFIQPSIDSSVLSRVTGSLQSDIFGSLISNGQLVFVNPNGFMVGDTASIQSAGLILSTLDIQTTSFLSESWTFKNPDGYDPAQIINQGSIEIVDSGFLVLLSDHVENQGSIIANLGQVQIGAANQATITFDNQGLIQMVIDEGIKNELIEQSMITNTGSIEANGGIIEIKAKAVQDTLITLVNSTGILEATHVSEKDGVIVFESNGQVNVSGDIEATTLSIEEGTTVSALDDVTISIQKDWDNQGSFEGTNSTVNFTSNYDSQIKGDNTFGNLIIQGTEDKSIYFEANKTQTITGLFNTQGSHAKYVRLLSSEYGEHWYSDSQGDRDLTYTWVEDAYNLNANKIIMTNSTNRGNSPFWDPTGTWSNGGGTNIWSDVDNWSGLGGAATPGAGDAVVFDGTSNTASSVDASFAGTIGSLSLSVGYSNTVTLARSLTVDDSSGESGDISLNAGTLDDGGNAIALDGDWNNSTGSYTGTGTVSFTGGATQTMTSGGTTANKDFTNITITNSSTLQNIAGVLDIDGTLTINSGSVIDLNGINLNLATLSNSGTFLLEGDETVTLATMDTDSGLVKYAGNSTYIGLALGDNYFSLEFDNAGGSWTLDNAIDVNGNLSLTNGTLNDAVNTIDLAGNWTNAGTATFSGSFNMDGTNQSITGSTSFQDFTKSDSTNNSTDAILTIDNTSTQTISGAFSLVGTDADDRVNLVSDSPGTQWSLNCGGCTLSVDFADITDSDASGGDAISGYTNTLNSGNNLNWGFATYTWDGSSSTDWNTAANWDLNAVPGTTDDVVIANVANDPLLDSTRTVASLTVNSSGILDLNGNGLTISGVLSNSGTVILQGDETVAVGTMDTDSGLIKYDGAVTEASLAFGSNYFDLQFDNGGGSWTANATVDVNGNLTITNGSFADGGNAVNIAGNWSNAGTYTNSGNVTFDGGGTSTITTGGTGGSQDFSVLQIANNTTLQVTTNGLSASGTVIAAGSTLDMNGQTFITSALTNNGTFLLEGGESITIASMDTDSGLVKYDGAASYANLAAGDNYFNLEFDNSGGGDWTLDAALDVNGDLSLTNGELIDDANNITLAGNWTNSGTATFTGFFFMDGGNQSITGSTRFSNFSKTDSTDNSTDAILTIDNTALLVMGGNFTLAGTDADDRVNLVSDSPGTQWSLDCDFCVIAIDFADITDSDASSGDVISGYTNTVSSGNNLNWGFGSTYTWDGSSSTDWNTAANWDLNAVPGTSDDIVIANVANDPILDSTRTVNTLTVNSSGILDLDGNGLTITGILSNSGIVILQGDETVSVGTMDTDSGLIKYDGAVTAASLSFGSNYFSLEFDNAGGDWSANATLDVNGNLTITNGVFQDGANTTTLAGNWSNAGTYTGTGTVSFNGATTQTLTSGGTGTTQDFTNITVTNSSTLQTITNALDIDGTLTIVSGSTADLNAQNLTLGTLSNAGTLLLEGGETVTVSTMDTDSGIVKYDGAASYANLAAGDNYFSLEFDNAGGGDWTLDAALDVNGNLAITNGTLIDGGFTTTLAGNWSNAGTATLTGALTLDGGNQSLTGSTTFNNLSKTDGSNNSTDLTLTIDNTATQTINGTLTLQGIDSDDRVNLVSDSPGTQWSLDCNSCTIAIDYLDVIDSDASSGTIISGYTNTVDSGNNSNWSFAAAAVVVETTTTTTVPDPNPTVVENIIPNGFITEFITTFIEVPIIDAVLDVVEITSAEQESTPEGVAMNNQNPLAGVLLVGLQDDFRTPNMSLTEEFEQENVGSVYVHEGTVDVNNVLVNEGESVLLDEGQPLVTPRILNISTARGLQMLRAKTYEEVRNIKTGSRPIGLANSTNGKQMLLALNDKESLIQIDTTRLKRSGNIRDMGKDIADIQYSPKNNNAYVTHQSEDNISSIKLGTNATPTNIQTGSAPIKSIVSDDNQHIYVVNELDQTIQKINIESGEEIIQMQMTGNPYDIKLSNDGTLVYVSNRSLNQVWVGDIASGEWINKVNVGQSPHELLVDFNSNRLYVSNRQSHDVSVIDTNTLQEINKISVGKRPSGLAITPEGDKLYVANTLSHTVSVVDVAKLIVIEDIAVNTAPTELLLTSPARPRYSPRS
ncbi:MAG: filamentous hemagglutinin family protein [Candidatus Omnitrophota bacterium]|jgi:filamentous hemagglutinin family protein